MITTANQAIVCLNVCIAHTCKVIWELIYMLQEEADTWHYEDNANELANHAGVRFAVNFSWYQMGPAAKCGGECCGIQFS